MAVPDHKSTRRFTSRPPGRGAVVAVVSLAVGLGAVAPVAAGAAERPTTARPVAYRVVATEDAVGASSLDSTSVEGALAALSPFDAAMRDARTSLTTAETYLQNRQYLQAIPALSAFRVKLAAAHQIGMTPMGPAKVLAVFTLEHRVAKELRPFFNGMTRSDVIAALQTTLSTTFDNRTAMLTAVVALPQGEEGPDYDDPLIDTLPIYTAEVQSYQAALMNFTLIPQSSAALTRDLAQIRATRQQFTQRFGGGE